MPHARFPSPAVAKGFLRSTMSLIRKGRQIRKLRPYAVLPAAIPAISPGSSRSNAIFSIAWFLRLGGATLEHSTPDIENRIYFLRVKQFASVTESNPEHTLRPGIEVPCQSPKQPTLSALTSSPHPVSNVSQIYSLTWRGNCHELQGIPPKPQSHGHTSGRFHQGRSGRP